MLSNTPKVTAAIDGDRFSAPDEVMFFKIVGAFSWIYSSIVQWVIEQCRLREMIDTKDSFSNLDEIHRVGGVDISFVTR